MPRRSAAALAVRPAERSQRKQDPASGSHQSRRLFLEQLEDRRLMAVGPQLVSVRTSGGNFLNDGDTRNDAVVDLTFRFNEGQQIDATTLDAIRLTRSGFDGVFDDPVDGFGDDVFLQPGFLGLGDVPNEVVMRFAEPLLDDLYRIDIVGAGLQPLRNDLGEAFNDGVDERIEFELDLGAQVVAIVPQPMSRVGGVLAQARNRIDVYFNDDDLFVEYDGLGNPTPRSAEHPNFYHLILTNDTVRNTDDVTFLPSSVSYDPTQDRATLLFGSNLDLLINPNTGLPVGNSTFRLRVGVSQEIPAPPVVIDADVAVTSDFNTGGAVQIRFEADPRVVEQYGTSTRIEITKSDHLAAGPPVISVSGNRIQVDLNTHAGSPSTAGDLVAAINGDPDASSLVTALLTLGAAATDITTPAIDYSPLILSGLGSSVQTATDLGVLSPSGVLVASQIDPQFNQLDFPGAPHEPGHRDIPEDVGSGFDQHINAIFGIDHDLGLTTILYNFQPNYGTSVAGDPLTNLITENQKLAARQAFSVWGEKLGVQFLETATEGLTVVTGDPTALDPNASNVVNHVLDFAEPNLNFIVRVDPNFANGTLILDNAHQWDDTLGGEWFRTAMIGLGFMLGLERAEDLPESTVMSYVNSYLYPGSPPAEPVFLDNHDVVHGQLLYRPDSNDIDLYRFEIDLGDTALPENERRSGVLTLETLAERQANASTLNSVLALYKEVVVRDELGNVIRSEPQLISRNDDYFNEDSYIEVEVGSGVYYVGVTASGNNDYDPIQEDTGFGGTSQGKYDLRIGIRPQDDGDRVIRDLDRIDEATPGTPLDGDADGTPGGAFNFWFRAAGVADTIYVDKAHTTNPALPRGTLTNPYNAIDDALAVAQPQDVVRIVANGGLDGNLSTLGDNFAYEIGFGTLPGQILDDGTAMPIPAGVTVMVDPGAVFKLRQARIGVGSSSLSVDRSNGALQVLGTPRNQVQFTSWLDESIGLDRHLPTTTPSPGDWGGLVFRNDLDGAEGRFNLEDQGIFLNYVNQANIRFGGGRVTIESVQQVVNPIQMIEMRPTITFNTIRRSADAAMSADPNSFEETNFHGPIFQQNGLFTADYSRIGPDIHGNRLANNSTNALFVRIVTPAGSALRKLTVPGRFNDTDIVHVLAENLQVQGAPGGRELDTSRPPAQLVTSLPQNGGSLLAGAYNYKVVFVDTRGFQGRPSLPTSTVNLSGAQGSVRLNNLPPVTSGFRSKLIYRSQPGGQGPYALVADVPASVTTFLDTGAAAGATLVGDPPDSRGITLATAGGGTLEPGRYNYRLTFVDAQGNESPASDPSQNLTTAATGSINVNGLPAAAAGFVGRRLYRSTSQAEGPYVLVAELNAVTTTFVDNGSDLEQPLDPTSYGVVRSRGQARLAIDPGTIVKLEGARIELTFGAQLIAEGINGRGVTLTSKLDDRYGAGGTFDTNNDGTQSAPAPGDWGGLYVGPLGTASVDYALLSFGGGINRIEGTFTAFNMIEVHEGDLRLTHSVIENAAPGVGGLAPADRFGRGTNLPTTIFIRGAQPTLKGNLIRDNTSSALTINANSLTHHVLPDLGRSTGFVEDQTRYDQNQGPLIRENIVIDNALNGVIIRGETLTTESVWDDTSIVHVLFDQIVVPDFHTYGGLRLQSSTTDRLVVKLSGPGDNFDSAVGAGFTVTGRPLENSDRIGGILHIVGEADFPVVITSLQDDSVGAGFRPDGSLQTDTNNDGIASVPRPGDWRSVRLDQFSHDRNVEVVLEREAPGTANTGDNNTPDRAQFLGVLASSETSGDDNLRLGFEVRGLLQQKSDVDVYSFDATAGTEIWLDIDRSSTSLDSVIELITSAGQVRARSDNSLDEATDPNLLFHTASVPANQVNPLPKLAPQFQARHVSGLPKDHWSLNELDAGMRIVLPGVAGTLSTYHLRVRSSSEDLTQVEGGLTSGVYVMQIRLRETDELAGSTIRNADIRYATNAIELFGLPGHSPLLGEAAEDESIAGPETNNHIIWNQFVPGSGAQDLGNLLNVDRSATSIAGSINTLDDVDFFEFQIKYDAIGPAVNTFEHFPAVFDLDYADGLSRPNTNIVVFDEFGRPVLIGRDSNIADDRLDPLADGDLSDLTTGSIGVLDPYIGPVMLPEGTYFVAVVSNARLPRQLLQNPITRVEPVNSVIRIVEDHIGSFGGSTAAPPEVPVLLDNSSIIPMDPEDVTLFVIQDLEDDDDLATLTALDPFTGAIKWTVGDYEGQVFDIATRLDGNVFGLSAPDTNIDDASAGLLQGVNTSAEQFVGSRDTLIETFHQDPLNPGIAVPSDVGMLFHAMTYGDLGDGIERLFAVGSRGDANDPLNPRPTGPAYFTNILYQIDPKTGQALSAPQADRTGNARFQGAGTQIVERGFLDTNTGGGPGGIVAGLAVLDNVLYALSDTSGLFIVNDPLSNTASLTYIGDLVDSAGVTTETGGNNDTQTAQDLDLEVWTQRYSDQIGDQFTNTSTTIKHITIHGTGDDGFVDFFPAPDPGGLTTPEGLTFGPDVTGDGREELYVASAGTDEILRYDGVTGEFIDAFVTAGSGTLSVPQMLRFHRDVNMDGVPELLVSGFGNNAILQYDGASGLPLGPFVLPGAGGLMGPTGFDFGPDGNLYVSSATSDEVLRYNGILGTFIDSYATGGGLNEPQGLVFGPDNNLYVASKGTDSVLRYDGFSGVFTDAFVPSGSGGLQDPDLGLVFGPDGHLYVGSEGSDEVLRYHGRSGAFMGAYVRAQAGGLDGPSGMVFDTDGNLYVSSSLGNKILYFNDDFREDDWIWYEDFADGNGVGGGDMMGQGLDFDGDTIAVGAPGDDSAANDGGAVYIFVRDDKGTPADDADDDWTLLTKLVAGDAAVGDRFGAGVSLDGDRLAVGAPGFDATIESTVADTMATTTAFRGSSTLSSLDDAYNGLTLTFTMTTDGMLQSVARVVTDYNGATRTFTVAALPVAPTDGDTFEIAGLTDAGAVYVYARDDMGTPNLLDDVWTMQDKVVHLDALPQDQFGYEVDVRSDALAVGVPQETRATGFVNQTNAAANQFNGDNGLSATNDFYNGLVLQFTAGPLRGQRQVIQDYVGNNRTFVFANNFPAAPANNAPFQILSPKEGAAYLFRESGGSWTQQARLRASDGTGLNLFGRDVELHAVGVLVGAPSTINSPGAVYDFSFNNQGSADPLDDTWMQRQKVTSTDGAPFDQFGWELAVDGTTLAVGAIRDDDAASDSGSVYIFDRNSMGNWQQSGKITASDGAAGDLFGMGLDLEGNRIVIGAPDGDEGVLNSGSVYVFERDDQGNSDPTDDIWMEFAEVAASNPAPDGVFGGAVAVHRDTLLAGDHLQDRFGVNAGTAQLFVLTEVARATFIDSFVPMNTGGLDDPRDMVIGPDGKLYVSSARSDSIIRFLPSTREFDTIFVPTGLGELDEPHGLVFGRDVTGDGAPDLYVASRGANQVLIFDGVTGEFVRVFVDLGLDEPADLTFGPDATGDGEQELYVSNVNADNILRFNGVTGKFVSVFVPVGLGGLDQPVGMEFRPDGYLYVASAGSDNILRYRSSNGAFVDDFISSGNGLNEPQHFTFAPDGNVYVTSFANDSVYRYEGATGAFLDVFSPFDPLTMTGNEGLDGPVGILVGPDGLLYVASSLTDAIYRFDTAGTPTYDYYKFSVENAGDRGIFDIDFGDDGSGAGFNAEIFILSAAGGVIATNDDFSPLAGELGSVSRGDSFLEFTFPDDGEYYIVVGEFDSDQGGGGVRGNRADLGDTYTLHVSMENWDGRAMAGMARRPRFSEGDLFFTDTLFTIDTFGELYAFDTNADAKPVFSNGQSVLSTGVLDAFGLSFSSTLWHVTEQRRTDLGHGLSTVFDDSRGNAADVREIEDNDTLAKAQDLEQQFWNLRYDANIGDNSEPPVNTSIFYPHITVQGRGDGTHDYYSFEVTQPNAVGLFEIDMSHDHQLSVNGFLDDDPFQFMDAELTLFDSLGNALAFNRYPANPTDGDAGNDFLAVHPFVDPPPLEPFIRFQFPTPGTYVLRVTKLTTTQAFVAPDVGDFYTLQVSVEGHRLDGPPVDGGKSFFFGTELGGEVQNATAGEVRITSIAHGLLGGERVYVEGVRGLDGANGTFVVDENGPDVFTLVDSDATGTYLGGGTWRMLRTPEDINGKLLSNPFSLRGYSPEDKPTLYFNYLLDADGDPLVDIAQVSLVEENGTVTPLAVKNAELNPVPATILTLAEDIVEIVWRQARVELDDFAGLENMRLLFEFDAVDQVATDLEGFFIDDIIIGFAERGEMISHSYNDPVFVANPDLTVDEIVIGDYQLEIRPATDYGRSSLLKPNTDEIQSLHLETSFDTNDRLASQFTMLVPPASAIADGDTFTLYDGIDTVVFEFDVDGDDSVVEGHARVAILSSDEDYEVARKIRDAINSDSAQSRLEITAGLSDGSNEGIRGNDHRLNLYGNAIVTGTNIPIVAFDGVGDANQFRDQGQLLVHSNFVTDARDWGIVADAGQRRKETGVDVGFLQPSPGPVRRLQELNNAPPGGLAPGVTIENNVIAGEGLGGIHFSGNEAPWEIIPFQPTPPLPTSGDRSCDGVTFVIRSGRTSVTFELEDISGSSRAQCGSGIQGGDGWTEGNVPVFFRRTGSYPTLLGPRGPGYDQYEMVLALRDAINGSILVTNGTTNVVKATVGMSRGIGGPFLPDDIRIYGAWPALYLENVSFVTSSPSRGFISRQVPLAEAPQPFGRIVNNTIYGHDGTESFFAGSGLDEPNDTIFEAVKTFQGRAQNPEVYFTQATIGDNLDTPFDRSMDVDFYKVHLDIYDRITIDVDANEPGGRLNPVLRLFNALGQEVAISDNDPAPGETRSLDAYIDFTATEAGTYYVGISGALNYAYSAISLGDRQGESSRGDYDLEINVWAPRDWVIQAVDGSLIPDGATIQVKDVSGNVVTYEFDSGGGVAGTNVPIVFDPSPVPNSGNRGPGYRAPEVAVAAASVIGNGLTGVTATPLGGHRGASANGPVAGRPSPFFLLPLPDRSTDPDMEGFSHDHYFTPPISSTELFIVIEGAANVTSSFLPLTPNAATNNVDGLLRETGILVSENASPTLLNNALVNLESGILQMDSPTTIVGASLYQHNLTTNSNVGATNEDFSIALGDLEPLFVDTADGNFYPARMSRAIDSAIDTLEDRNGFVTVKNPVGISVSPILAPDRDASGQLRVDDPEVAPPLGLGANVFKDRGAVDRADFVGPAAVLVEPLDNDTLGIDLDRTETIVQLAGGQISTFRIQLVDGATQGDSGAGIGVDDSSVTTEKISITEDGVLLRPGVDYNFRYDATTNVVGLTHVTGVWPNNRTYVIRLNNTDRFVIDTPRGDQVTDGQSFFIQDQFHNVVTFEYESGFSMFVPSPLSLQIPVAGVGTGGVTDGQTLVIAPPLGAAVTFEYDTNFPPNVFSGNVPINISSAVTQDDVANATVNAILAAGLGLQPANLGGGVVHLGARRGFLVDTSSTNVDQSGFAGVVVDGESFVVSQGATMVRFEFNETILANGVGFMRTPIEFDHTFTQDELVDAIALAIQNAGLGLLPANLSDGLLHLGGDVTHDVQIPVTSRLAVSGLPGVQPSTTLTFPGPVSLVVPQIGALPGGIEDGQTFSIDDGMQMVVFEFENGQILDGVTGMNTAIVFDPNDSIDDLADNIADVIGMAGLNLSPVNVGNGVIELAATIDHVIDPLRSTLSLIGRVDGVEDGEIFTISRAGNPPVVFEFDDDNNTLPGSRVIRFTAMTTDDELIDATIASIQAGGLGLNPVKLSSLSLRLMDTAAYATDVSGSSLEKTGVAGGAVAVPFIPDDSFSEIDFAQPVVEAIVTSPLQNVEISQRGASSFFVDNANAISGDIPNFFARAIRDLAGNLLLPNQSSSQTQFIILMPNVELDFGDAPPQYSTTFAQNGARHAITSNGLFLGAGVDADADGQPTAGADGDDTDAGGNDDDGVRFDGIFNRFLVTPITVTASATGLLDAWIDFNQDGDFDDLSEQVFAGERLFTGDNALTIATPSFVQSASNIVTAARFRFSSSGGTESTGLAADGEIEDYLITILPGTPPVAGDDFYRIDEDSMLDVPAPGLLMNDSDAESDPLTVLDFDTSSTLGATVAVNPDGSFQYDPASIPALQSLAEGDLVLDTFTYRASDGVLPSNPATVTVTVDGVNDAPVAADVTLTAQEDGVTVTADFDGDDIDSDDDQASLQYTILTLPAEGAVVNNDDGTFTFDPSGAFQDLAAGETRVVSFTYRATDSHNSDSNTATVTITVSGINDPPVVSDVAINAVEDGPTVDGAFDGDDADSNDSPASLIYTLTSVPSQGSVVNNDDGTFTFDPGSDFQDLALGETTVVTFDYVATDSLSAISSPATVQVTVTGVNDAPTTTDLLINAIENGPGVLGNFGGDDVDSDNNPTDLVYSLLTLPGEGGVTNNGNGTFTFSPGSDFQDLAVGEVRFVAFDYQATDRHGALSVVATVTVRVTGVNDAPTASGVMTAAVEDGPAVTAAFLGDDIDSDDTPGSLSFLITSTPSEGSVNNNRNGTFSFDPGTGFQDLALGQTRNVTFNYVAIDSHSVSSTPGTVTIVVTGVNDAPRANDVGITAREDGPVVRTVFNGNDIDNDDNQATLTYEILSQPSEGTALNNSDGTFSFDPEADFQDLALGATRIVSFTYQATDRHGAVSVVGSVNVTVTGVNDSPVANDVAANAMEDGPAIVVPFDADDIDNDDSRTTLSYALLSTPGEGSITQVANGTFTYNPGLAFQDLAAGETRVVSFNYRATDSHGASDTSTVFITVSGVNDTPVARPNSYSINQLSVLDQPASGLLGNDTDADASDSVRVLRLGSSGGLTGTSNLGAAITLRADGSFLYDPTVSSTLSAIPRGSSRLDTFTYVIADTQNAMATATVSITVLGVNKPPIVGPDFYQTLEDTVIVQPAATGVLNNDLDPDGDSLTITGFQNPSTLGATVTVGSNGSFTYDPTTSLQLQALGLGDTAMDTFTVTVSDGQGASVVSTVNVTVEGLNERPVAVPDNASTPQGTPVLVNILANDSDLDGMLVPSSIALVTNPQNGTAVPNGLGGVLYSPTPGFRGTDTFRYTVQDDDGAVSNTALVTILVNNPPTAVDDLAQAFVNLTVNVDVLANDSDSDGAVNLTTVAVVSQPEHGVATPNTDGTVSYTPDQDYTGPDTFQYTVRDDSGTVSNVATVTLDVSANPFPWHNTRLRYDVNNDGRVTPVDPLIIINRINTSGAGPLPIPPTPPSPPPYYDVVPDNQVAPSDVNAVVNYLNTVGSGEGEYAESNTLATSQGSESLELIVEGRVPVIDPARFIAQRPVARGTETPSSLPWAAAPSPVDAPVYRPSGYELLETLAEELSSRHRSAHANDLALEELFSEDDNEL